MAIKKTIIVILTLSLLLSVLSTVTSCNKTPDTDADTTLEPAVDPIDDNYRTFYQIFVGSFSDSNGDGFGDLRGIINRFDYLNDGDINSGNDLGVQGIWLSPIFSSPTYHKYDAADYYKIDWRFGEEKDLVELIELCHERSLGDKELYAKGIILTYKNRKYLKHIYYRLILNGMQRILPKKQPQGGYPDAL